MRDDILRKAIEKYANRIEASNKISPRNKQFILDFKRKCHNDPGIGLYRLRTILAHCLVIGEVFDRLDFDKAERKDIDMIIERIENLNLSSWTKSDRKKILKNMYNTIV